MKIIFAILPFVVSALAQSAAIGFPTPNTTLSPGQQTTVIVERPDTLTGSTEVGIGITIQHCTQNPCQDFSEDLGDILFAGAFNPQFHTAPGLPNLPPYQNYTVTIPASLPTGKAVLSVVHSSLVGAGPFFLNEILNVTFTIQ